MKPIPTREPDPDRQEGGEVLVEPAKSVARLVPPPDSLAGRGKLRAPRGRFRLVGVDTFAGPFEDFLVGDFEDLDDAKREAVARASRLVPFYIYNERGQMIFSAGR